MKKILFFICSYFALTHLGFAHIQATKDTRLLHSPTISSQKIAFIYAEDLWVAESDGSNPKRVTIDEGVESSPVFSPDGSMIAFSAEYDGNRDIYIIPSEGGIPKRLTWHPAPDVALGFTPDGKKVLFRSPRSTFTRRHSKLYTIKISGGQPQELPIPTAFKGTYSPDGKYLAYVPNREIFNQWKHYRGGTLGRIWIMNLTTYEITEIPKTVGGSNDADPEWIGNNIYFRSDRNGEFNLYSYNSKTKQIKQHTFYKDFGIMSLNTNNKKLIYECTGYLYKYDPATEKNIKIRVGISTDLLEVRPKYISGNQYIRTASVSPSAKRVAFDFRGEIVTIPEKKGDVFSVTKTPGVHEKYPAWAPNGKSIAYFSDASGEYALHIKTLSNNTTKKISLSGAGFYAFIHWSPDSKKIAFVDNSRSLYLLDIARENIKKIAQDKLYVPGVFRELFGSWSYDSKWISYTIVTETNFEQAFVYSLDKKKSYTLSDGLSNVAEPTFDPSGKYIYLLASTDAGPVVNWFDQSSIDMEMNSSIYLITLQKSLISPLAKQNDVELGDQKKKKRKDKKKMRIDWEGILSRMIDLPIKKGMYYNLSSPEEGKIYYISQSPHSKSSKPQSLMMYDLEKRKSKKIMTANQFEISANGKKMLFRRGNKWGITKVGKKDEKDATLKTSTIKIKINPISEWKNIFHEAWRVNRDYFYDPNMHGVDWKAMEKKYEPFLADLSCRSDLYRIMQWMFSELGVGHHRFGNIKNLINMPQKVSGGLLGADYQIKNNRYQIKKIYGGLNWNPGLRAPLTEPGVNVKIGDYIISVNGMPVTAKQNLYSFFENTAGKIVTLKVSNNPSSTSTNSRTVRVVPIENENALRNRDWVEKNIQRVNQATNGQVAYVYVPNTAFSGHTYFKRYFFPQANKKAIIIDERFNSGGYLADYYIDHLRKPYQASWSFRYGQDLKSPSASIQGPKVMIIDENAGSGGDYLPWMFRKYGLGKLIGKRTWGGLVGVLGFPEFIDGATVSAPNVAFYNEKGFRIENEGVAPDIEVEQLPKEVIKGYDPQLEKAIEVVMEELKKNPPKYPERPPYPKKMQKQ